jgi:calcineurin-like phosphoesterase family protein
VTYHWFTADWHLGHARICELSGRPFASVDEMNEEIVARHNAVVAPDDTLWILGDVCMGPIQETLALIQRVNGKKYLVAGNHDRCFHGYGDNAVNAVQFQHWVAEYRRAGFGLVDTGHTLRRRGFGTLVELAPTTRGTGNRTTFGVQVELSHFPTVGESDPNRADRFADYRPRPLGGVDRRSTTHRWVLCGHVHEAWLTRGRNLNVGVDQWNFGPVRDDELAELIKRYELEYGTRLDGDLTTPGPGRVNT